jgi:dethiobiotin synthetase
VCSQKLADAAAVTAARQLPSLGWVLICDDNNHNRTEESPALCIKDHDTAIHAVAQTLQPTLKAAELFSSTLANLPICLNFLLSRK